MRHEEIIGQHVTQAYASLMRNEIQLKYPNFYFERGVIMYDYDHETYMYYGFTEEEQTILNEAAKALLRN